MKFVNEARAARIAACFSGVQVFCLSLHPAKVRTKRDVKTSVRIYSKANDPAQAGRGIGDRLLTGAQFRPCLQPDGWASSISRNSCGTLCEGTGLLGVIIKPDLESMEVLLGDSCPNGRP